MITERLETYVILLDDCSAQNYNNAASMSGKYNSAQAIIKKQCPTAIFSPWLPQTQFIYVIMMLPNVFQKQVDTYFVTTQTICLLFNCSPKRWKILAKRIGSLLYGISGTRMSDRVNSVKPFVAHLPGVKEALEDLLKLNIIPKTRNKIHGAMCYDRSFASS